MAKPVSISNTFAAVTTASTVNLDADFTTLKDALNDPLTYAVNAPDSGAANVYTVTLNPAPAAQANLLGVSLSFKANAANTGGSTLNVNALGAQAIVRPGGLALQAGDIPANGTVTVIWDGTNYVLQTFTGIRGLTKLIYGLTYANSAGDAVNDLDIAAGGAMDATGAYFMIGSALTKQSDVNWAVGTAAGGLDTGSVGNSDYYIWVIARSDTGVVDYLFSLSNTAPTMPANYNFKRLFGWFKRVGGTIVAFTTYETEGGGLELLWTSPTLDINLANTLGNSRRTDAVKVPLNFSTIARLNGVLSDSGGSGNCAWVYCPDQTDLAPSVSVAPLGNMWDISAVAGVFQITVRTSAAGLIAARATFATYDVYAVSTMGFNWARRN